MKRISDEEARNFGVEAKYDLMDNGERRFRSIYLRTRSYTRLSMAAPWTMTGFPLQS